MRKERVLLRSLGIKLKSLRQERKLTQQVFADKIEVSLETVKNWEQGWCYPSIDFLVKITDFFKCDFDYLLGRQDAPNKVYKHFAAETGLSEKAIENLLLFCGSRHTRACMIQPLLEDTDLLLLLDSCVIADYENTTITAQCGCDKWEMNNISLYNLHKLELYYYLSELINECRKNYFESIK